MKSCHIRGLSTAGGSKSSCHLTEVRSRLGGPLSLSHPPSNRENLLLGRLLLELRFDLANEAVLVGVDFVLGVEEHFAFVLPQFFQLFHLLVGLELRG